MEKGGGIESEVCYSVIQCKLLNDFLGRLFNKVS